MARDQRVVSLCGECQRNGFLLGHRLLNSVSKHSLHYQIFLQSTLTMTFSEKSFQKHSTNIMGY